MKVAGLEVWTTELEDRPGKLAEKLAALAKVGVNLEFMISQRGPDAMAPVRVFVGPIKGAKRVRAAQEAGLQKLEGIFTLRIQGADKKGLLAAMTVALGAQGINLVGATATVAGKQSITYMAVEGADNAKLAARLLKRVK